MIGRVVFVLLAGCGRVAFAPLDDATGGSGSGGDDNAPPGLTYREAVIADVPLAYWRLNDADTTARDEMGFADGVYAGTCGHGVPGALANDPDTAVHFDGGSCEIALGDHFDMPNNQPYSIEAWGAWDGPTTSGFQHLVTREMRNGGPLDGYALAVEGSLGTFTERVAAANSNTPRYVTALGRFVHYVATYTGTQLTLYVDGVAFGSVPATDALATFAQVAYIGSAPDPSGSSYYQGTLDEIAIYDHALAADRIALHHALGAGP